MLFDHAKRQDDALAPPQVLAHQLDRHVFEQRKRVGLFAHNHVSFVPDRVGSQAAQTRENADELAAGRAALKSGQLREDHVLQP